MTTDPLSDKKDKFSHPEKVVTGGSRREAEVKADYGERLVFGAGSTVHISKRIRSATRNIKTVVCFRLRCTGRSALGHHTFG